MPFSSASLQITSNIIVIPGIARCMFWASSRCFSPPFFPSACGRCKHLGRIRRWRRSWFCRLDTGVGAAILGAAVLLLLAAAFVVSHASTPVVWSMTATLIGIGIGFQVAGHRLFERRQPALVDNPSHLLLGPMFVMAKLFIALGFRRDLAAIIQTVPSQAQRGPSSFAEEHQVEPLPRS
jgi:hypothetical protein